MFPTIHMDLFRVVQAERVSGSHRTSLAEAAPVTPAHIRTFGPRASRRAAARSQGEVIALPSQRQVSVLDLSELALVDA